MERHLSSFEEAQLAEALERKRKQIDREIAEYISEKEKEFYKFEKRLRSEKRDAERQKILQCEREVEKADQRRRGSRDNGFPAISTTSYGVDGSQSGRRPNRSNGVRFANATEIPLEASTGYPKKKDSPSSRINPPLDQQPVHEHEVEFQGLFTPSYLPLLSGEHSREQQSPVENGNSSSPKGDKKKKSPESAESAPESSRPESSNDLRAASMAERRSSSRSDSSVSSLRSSLRDPKQARSPKRVQFSLDNVVVSPSTGPAVQRKAGASKSALSSLAAKDQASGLKSSRDRENTGHKPVSWRRDLPTQSTQHTLTNIPTVEGLSNGASKPIHPAASIANISPSIGGDDFEHVGDEDDLFTFDEDMSYRAKDRADSGGTPGDDDNDFGGHDDDHAKDGLPASSPYAGSLPIEIKWPGRKDPRG